VVEKGYFTQNDADAIDREMKDEMERAVKFALESPYPAPEEALDDVYA
jgi:TPP-dependent pyruvate/acetoin dehydrogenase alpha subunit